MGGAQMYVRNKCIFELKKASKVYVISATPGEIVIEDLKQYKSFIKPIFNLSPFSVSKRKRANILSRLLQEIHYCESDTIQIESNDTIISLWGELIANITNGKHFVFLLNEGFSNEERSYCDFFDFKHKRRELAGIQPLTIKELFVGYKEVQEGQCYKLLPNCTNVVDDCYHPIVETIDDKKVNICSIGRLNKPYVKDMCIQIHKYCSSHPEKKYRVILLGDSPDKRDRKMAEDILKKSPNIELIITGYIFPIPRQLFAKIEVFVSCAGSVWPSYYEKRPTISIDHKTNMALGIVGYNTMSSLFARGDDKPYPIYDALCAVLEEGVKPIFEENKKYNEDALIKNEAFVLNSDASKIYYNFDNHKRTRRERIVFSLNCILGMKVTSRFLYPMGRGLQNMIKKKG